RQVRSARGRRLRRIRPSGGKRRDAVTRRGGKGEWEKGGKGTRRRGDAGGRDAGTRGGGKGGTGRRLRVAPSPLHGVPASLLPASPCPFPASFLFYRIVALPV